MTGHRSRQHRPSNNARGSSHYRQSSSERSSSSGRYLTKNPHAAGDGMGTLGRSRSASSLRTAEEDEKIRIAGKRKTRLIVILGITLPVIACILGIVAWAVTTDILRITPRNTEDDNTPLEQFKSPTKTKDGLQPRVDQPETTVFQFHEATKKTRRPTTSVKTTMKTRTMTPTSRRTRPVSEQEATTIRTTIVSKKPAENVVSTATSNLFSKLLSIRTANKTPEFVVFAPILEQSPTTNENNSQTKKGKSLLKSIVDHDFDLDAEESVLTEEHDQEYNTKSNVNKKHRSKVGRRRLRNFSTRKRPFKSEEKISIKNQSNFHGAGSGLQEMDFGDSDDNLHHDLEGSMANDAFSGSKLMVNEAKKNIKMNVGSQRARRKNYNQNEPSYLSADSQEFQQSAPVHFQRQQHSSSLQSYLEPQQSSLKQSYQEQQQQSPSMLLQRPQSSFPQQSYPESEQHSSAQSYQGVSQRPSHQSFREMPVDPHYQSQTFQTNMKTPQRHQQQNYDLPSFSGYQQNAQVNSFSSQGEGPPPYNSGTNSYQQNFQDQLVSGPQTSFQRPSPSYQKKNIANEDPQYFAPPPQTFHTKTNYASSIGQAQSSMDNFDNPAQISVGGSMDSGGGRHHHHHRDNFNMGHDQHDRYSDLSNPSLTNDADRLGSIGISSGGSSPRGITLQIGGGPVGLTGLLPLGALGMARGILSSLLPRPALGLNGRVFVGLEVGKGGGLLG